MIETENKKYGRWKARKWTPEDLVRLRYLSRHCPPEDIAEKMNRSRLAITMAAHKHCVTLIRTGERVLHPEATKAKAMKLHAQGDMTFIAIGRLLGVHPRTVRSWVEREREREVTAPTITAKPDMVKVLAAMNRLKR